MINRPIASASFMDRSESTIKRSRYSFRPIHLGVTAVPNYLGQHSTSEVSKPECQEGRAEAEHDGVDDVEVHVRRVGEGRAHPFVDVDQRVDQDECLEPVKSADLHGREVSPGIVRATEKGDRQDDEAEHQADVARLERGAEDEPESGHGHARQGHEGEDHEPVEGDGCAHAGGVDHRRDGKDDGRRDETLHRARQYFRDGDEPNGARRLHAVLDLTGEAELLGHGECNRLHSLEHQRDSDDPGNENRREGRRACTPTAANRLTDLWKDEEEDEAQEKGLNQGPQDELPERLSQHHHVAQDQCPECAATRFEYRTCRGGLDGRDRHTSRSSLPVKLMKTVSRLGSATARSRISTFAASAAFTTRGTSRSPPCTCNDTTFSTTRVATTPSSSSLSTPARRSPSFATFTVTMVSTPVLFFKLAGVSSARIFP